MAIACSVPLGGSQEKTSQKETCCIFEIGFHSNIKEKRIGSLPGHLDFRTTTTIWKQKGDYLGEKWGESVGGENRAKKADVIKIGCTHL